MKEKIYDLGIFGKWSETTLREQVCFSDDKAHLDGGSALYVKVKEEDPDYPSFPKELIKKRDCFGNTKQTLEVKNWDEDKLEEEFECYLRKLTKYQVLSMKYEEEYDKMIDVIRTLDR